MKIQAMIKSIVISACVVGCSTAAQRQSAGMAQGLKATQSTGEACVRAVWDQPELSKLKLRRPANINEATLEQMTNQDHASNQEIKSLYLMHSGISACRANVFKALQSIVPTMVPILVSAENRSDRNLVDLIQQKLTWGEYLQAGKASAAELNLALTAEGKNIDAGLNQSHQAELTNRQAAIDALNRYAQNQQLINALNRPVNTSCETFGNTINCQSQ